jgi:hypothetical protein
MSRESVDAIAQRWNSDASFRAKLRANPSQAIQEAGLGLEPHELTALQSVPWHLSDEEITRQAREEPIDPNQSSPDQTLRGAPRDKNPAACW